MKPTEFLDSDHVSVREYAERNTREASSDVERAVQLYYAVRDGFQYDPYVLDLRRQAMKASVLLTKTRGYCVEKALLLAAAARAVGIPSRLSFYIVRNHIATERLAKALEKDYLVFHGAAEMYLDRKWVKATPAFNKRLCDFLGVDPIEFDGKSDAIFQEYDRAGNVFMEYLHDYGAFDDMPYQMFLDELDKHYPHLTNNPRFVTDSLVYDFRN
ncbi:MAG: transglutaminase-like domain-containing protein [Acidobacteriota bacterium]